VSYFLHVFATSESSVPPQDLADAADEAWYGDDELEFDLGGAPERILTITPPRNDRPITVAAETEPSRVATMVGEQIDEHDGLPDSVAGKLRRTRQVVSIEIFPDRVDDDVWEMLDVLQAYLARQLDGLVVTDDGVYDAGLQKIAE
jgi:hypothetical protein